LLFGLFVSIGPKCNFSYDIEAGSAIDLLSSPYLLLEMQAFLAELQGLGEVAQLAMDFSDAVE
jgi:hypothetical protein